MGLLNRSVIPVKETVDIRPGIGKETVDTRPGISSTTGTPFRPWRLAQTNLSPREYYQQFDNEVDQHTFTRNRRWYR